jgi:F-type H+-transporting ATPase subunit alpha
VIYAGTRGYLDKIPTNAVGRFEKGLLSLLHTKHQKLLDAIRTKKALDAELEGELKSLLESFASTFA